MAGWRLARVRVRQFLIDGWHRVLLGLSAYPLGCRPAAAATMEPSSTTDSQPGDREVPYRNRPAPRGGLRAGPSPLSQAPRRRPKGSLRDCRDDSRDDPGAREAGQACAACACEECKHKARQHASGTRKTDMKEVHYPGQGPPGLYGSDLATGIFPGVGATSSAP